MKNTRGFIYIACVLVSFCCIVPAYSALEYQAIPGAGVTSGYVDIYSASAGESYGYVRINYWNWQDGDGHYHYSYQLVNDGAPDTATDHIHFGWEYLESFDQAGDATASGYGSIYKFSIALDPDGDDAGPSDLYAISNAGSAQLDGTLNGGAWNPDVHCEDPGNIGVDWEVAGGNNPQDIDPARWDYDWVSSKGGKVWTNNGLLTDIDGEVSTDDGNSQYFHLTSSWGPGDALIGVATTSQVTASGYIPAPVDASVVVAPEPATCVLLGLGSSLIVASRRKRK